MAAALITDHDGVDECVGGSVGLKRGFWLGEDGVGCVVWVGIMILCFWDFHEDEEQRSILADRQLGDLRTVFDQVVT